MDLNKFKQKVLKNSPIKWKHSGFAMLPNSLLFQEGIAASELIVFWVLTVHLFKGKQYCYPSLRTIQTEARISRPTVVKALRKLQELGYLKINKGRKDGRNEYELLVKA